MSDDTGTTGGGTEDQDTEDDADLTPEQRAAKHTAQMEKRDQKKAGPHGKSDQAPGRVKQQGGTDPNATGQE